MRAELLVERKQLRQLFATYGVVLTRSLTEEPGIVEATAVGAFLHSFYNGIENILKQIALEVDGDLPSGDAWHRRLLDQMSRPGQYRSIVVSAGLKKRLRKYLGFRHVFRTAYVFNLRWEKMRPLVQDCQSVFEAFESEIEAFLRGLRVSAP